MMAYLHTKAEAKVRNLISLAYCCGEDLAFNTTAAESARNKDTGNITEYSGELFSSVSVSESTHLRFTVARSAIPPCFNASTTEM